MQHKRWGKLLVDVTLRSGTRNETAVKQHRLGDLQHIYSQDGLYSPKRDLHQELTFFWSVIDTANSQLTKT